MRALRNVGVLLGFCKILDIVKLHIVKTTTTILSQTIYIAHPYFQGQTRVLYDASGTWHTFSYTRRTYLYVIYLLRSASASASAWPCTTTAAAAGAASSSSSTTTSSASTRSSTAAARPTQVSEVYLQLGGDVIGGLTEVVFSALVGLWEEILQDQLQELRHHSQLHITLAWCAARISARKLYDFLDADNMDNITIQS